ncbi:MAG TPA: hypothetical protein VFM14_06680 [Gemmatimonadales bacterium]|nr:hypothetical protein [Gemmatimonadales bacterium]
MDPDVRRPVRLLAAFAIWFDQEGFRATDLDLGARTFRRIVEVVGITQPIAPAIEVGFTSSNIYTVFRDLIEDFGSVGAMLFVFVYGMVALLTFRRVTGGDLRAIPLLALVFAFAFTSFAIPMFLYTITTGAAVLLVLYFASGQARWLRREPPLAEVGR